jgi:molybdopterin-guanine dinucleotide biosynthesis protein A
MATVVFDDRPYDPFFNVNRPEDLAEAETIMDKHRP